MSVIERALAQILSNQILLLTNLPASSSNPMDNIRMSKDIKEDLQEE